MSLKQIQKDLQRLKNKEKAKILQGFFKTGKGQYGEGDIFLGIIVPLQRKTASNYKDLTLQDIQKLLKSKIHEYRLTALFILIHQYNKADEKKKKKIFNLYLENTNNINNWDLIDLSAPNIVGNYLLDKDRNILYKLANSNSLWEKRISILSTFEFIKNNEYKDTLKISRILLNDNHDLIHKSVGWMLREVGKRVSQQKEEEFLKKHYKNMPRTMLRYAIERFEETKRQSYLKK
jgi:3-methyladenine DNA glycosylase AlkD